MAELFDLYDAGGRPLGRSKERMQVHRDGDWHRSIGLWIVRSDGRLLFQRRSAGKDTWPGRLTASVSGHYAAGERLEDVLREAQEEIGVVVRAGDLIPLGLWRNDDTRVPGVFDRELQDIFFWPLDLPLTAFRLDPTEVSALVELWPSDLLALLAGSEALFVPVDQRYQMPQASTFGSVDQRYQRPKASTLAADCIAAGDATVQHVELVLEDFVPDHAYHTRVAQAALDYTGRRLVPGAFSLLNNGG